MTKPRWCRTVVYNVDPSLRPISHSACQQPLTNWPCNTQLFCFSPWLSTAGLCDWSLKTGASTVPLPDFLLICNAAVLMKHNSVTVLETRVYSSFFVKIQREYKLDRSYKGNKMQFSLRLKTKLAKQPWKLGSNNSKVQNAKKWNPDHTSSQEKCFNITARLWLRNRQSVVSTNQKACDSVGTSSSQYVLPQDTKCQICISMMQKNKFVVFIKVDLLSFSLFSIINSFFPSYYLQ